MQITCEKPEYVSLNEFLKNKNLEFDSLTAISKELNVDVISGSLVFGHGTNTSDIDLFRFTDEFVASTDNYIQANIRFDVESISKNTIKNTIDLMQSIDPLTNAGAQSYFDNKEILSEDIFEIITRTLRGIPISESGHELVTMCKQSNVSKFLGMNYRMIAENCLEDAVGLYHCNDNFSCHLQVNQSLIFALMSLLNINSIYCDRPKWVSFYLQNFNSIFHKKFLNLYGSIPDNRSDLKKKIKKVDQVLSGVVSNKKDIF